MSINGIGNKKADITPLKSGLQAQQFKDDKKMESLFNAMDKDKNGIVTQDEIDAFLNGANGETGIDKNGNQTVTRREAKKFLKNNQELQELDINKKDVIAFLNKAGIESEGIENSKVLSDGTLEVNYKNQPKKVFDTQTGSYKVINQESEAGEYTDYTNFDKDGNQLSKVEKDAQNQTTSVTTFAPGTNTIQEVVITKDDGSETTIITYGDNGKPVSKQIEKGTTLEQYTYDENGKEHISSKRSNIGLDGRETLTEYSYNNDGTHTETLTNDAAKIKIVSNFDKENKKTTETEINALINTKTDREFKDGKISREIVTDYQNKTAAQNLYNEDGNKTSQIKKDANRTYAVEYDGKGNTKVVLQNRESIQQLAKNFNCSVEDLQKLNNKKTFAVGDTVIVPSELEADDARIKDRHTSEQAKAEHKRDLAQQAKIKKQLAPYGIQNLKGMGSKVSVNGKQCTVVGDGMFGTQIVMDSKNVATVIDKNTKKPVELSSYINKVTYARGSKITLASNVGAARTYTEGAGPTVVVKGPRYQTVNGKKVRDPNGRYIGILPNGQEVVISGAVKLPNGQTIGGVTRNQNGQEDLSQLNKRMVLNEAYVADSDAADRGIVVSTSYSDKSVSYGANGFAFKGVVPANDPRRTDAEGNYIDLIPPTGGSVDAQTMYKQDAAAIVVDLGKGKTDAIQANSGIVNAGILQEIDNHFASTEFGSYHAFLADKFNDKEAYVLEADLVANGSVINQQRRNDIIEKNCITYGDNTENYNAGCSAITTERDVANIMLAARKENLTSGNTEPKGYDVSDFDRLTFAKTGGDPEKIRAANNALYQGKTIFSQEAIDKSRAMEIAQFFEHKDFDNALNMGTGTQVALADTFRKNAGQATIHDLIPPDGSDHMNVYRMTKVINTGYIPYTDNELVSTATTYIKEHGNNNYYTGPLHYDYNLQLVKGVLRTEGALEGYKGIEKSDGDLRNKAGKMGVSLMDMYKSGYTLIGRPSEEYTNLSDEEKIHINNTMSQVREMMDGAQIDWDRVVNDEGYVDAILNEFRTAGWGGPNGSWGTTRAAVRKQLLQMREDFNQLQMASEGRLYNYIGQPQSFEYKFENFAEKYLGENAKLDKIYVSMDDYQSDQQTANTVLDIALTLVPVGKGAQIGLKLADGLGTVVRMGNLATKTTRVVAAGTGAGLLTGGAQYTKDRTNHMSSVTGDNIVTRAEDWEKAKGVAIYTGGSVMLGMGTGELVAPLLSKTGSKLAKTEEVLQKALVRAEESGVEAGSSRAVQIAQDAHRTAKVVDGAAKALGVTSEGILGLMGDEILNQLVYDHEMTEQEQILSLVGYLAGARAAHSGHEPIPASSHRTNTQTPKPATKLDQATGFGTTTPGGKFGADKFDEIVDATRQELQAGATPQRAAQLHQEGRQVQAVNRQQGRELQRVVSDESGFYQIGKERHAYADGSQAVIDEINSGVSKNASSILNGKQGVIPPHDVSILEDHLVNNLHTSAEVDDFMKQLEKRVGTKADGSLQSYQVQGQDNAAALYEKAKAKKAKLQGQEADFAQAQSFIPKEGGMTSEQLAQVRQYSNKPNVTEAELQSLVDQMRANPSVKKFGGAKKLISEMEDKIALMKAKKSAPTSPTGGASAVENAGAEVKGTPEPKPTVAPEPKPTVAPEPKPTAAPVETPAPKVETPAPKVETPAPKVETPAPKYSTDVNGNILPENYSNMSSDELLQEYQKLRDYEASGTRRRAGGQNENAAYEINSHDASSQKSQICKVLKEKYNLDGNGKPLQAEASSPNVETPAAEAPKPQRQTAPKPSDAQQMTMTKMQSTFAQKNQITLGELESMEKQLANIPECAEKTALQKTIAAKKKDLKAIELQQQAEARAAQEAAEAQRKAQANQRQNHQVAQQNKSNELESNFGRNKVETRIMVDGKHQNVTIYGGSQAGSNAGYWVKNNATGELSYVKYPRKGMALQRNQKLYDVAETFGMNPNELNETIEASLYGKGAQAHQEVLSADLYRAAGLESPQLSTVNVNGEVGVSSKFMSGLEAPKAGDVSAIREGFATDCWLANWDACKDGNVMMMNGKAVRTDVGGSLCYRARGQRKGSAFGENVDELTSFFGSNSLSKKYLTGMTRDELMGSLSHVTNISDETIKGLVKKAEQNGMQQSHFIEEMLIERRDYMRRFEQNCASSPMKPGETMEQYVNRMAQQTPRTTYNIGGKTFDDISASSRIYGKMDDIGRNDAERCAVLSTVNEKAKMSEHLTPSQKRMIEESYNAFEASKGKHIQHNAGNMLTEDNLLHVSSADNIESILNDGLMSREYSGKIGAKTESGYDPGSMTPLCSDLWDVHGSQTIGEYFDNRAAHWANPGESSFLPRDYSPSYKTGGDVVVVFDKKCADPRLIDNSFNISQKNSIMFEDGNMGGHFDYTTHRAVPVGLPANTIDRIIVRTTGRTNPNDIINAVYRSGKPVKVYDTQGNLLYDPATSPAPKQNRFANFFKF